MKYFKEMMERAKQSGVKSADESDKTEEFFEAALQCEPFVFIGEKKYDPTDPIQKAIKHLSGVDMGAAMSYCVGSDDGIILASPFKVFSIEIAGGLVTETSFEDQQKFNMNTMIACIMVREHQPNQFDFFTYYKVRKDGVETALIFHSDEKSIEHIVRVYIDRIHKEPEGYEKAKERIKFRVGGEKVTKEIKYVIHVGAARVRDSYRAESGREVDWTCRFLRRGHYRRFWKDKVSGVVDETRIGKDRDGNYCVTGMTWVEDAEINGKKDLPLIKKQRVVQ